LRFIDEARSPSATRRLRGAEASAAGAALVAWFLQAVIDGWARSSAPAQGASFTEAVQNQV
jgi:hypothetical protein